MTRATLLSLLAHPAQLAGPDVRALEELAQAFPYCQTAHLLLAKAAHDQDSMLASQRLRRAATYAADRARLRQLIELPAELPAPAPVAAEPDTTLPPPAPAGELAPPLPTPEASGPVAAAAPTPELLPESPPASPAGFSRAATTAGTPELLVASADSPAELADQAPEPEAAAVAPAAEATTAATTAELPEPATSPAAETSAAGALSNAPVAETPAAPAAAEATAVLTTEAPATTPVAETLAVSSLPEWLADADELPAQAPPIRPPAEAAARLEFGLGVDEPAEITAYRLPEAEELAPPRLASTPRLPPFSGVTDVGYAPCEGSRLGFGLVAVELAAATAMPGSELPPAGEFFAPDALLLDYLASQPAAEPARASSLDLINSFLQRAPLASRRRAMPSPAMPDPENQADLSLASTRAEFDLVSENLAHILARQGKNERAIAVYEKLMVKFPAKMPYFAAQIESLRP